MPCPYCQKNQLHRAEASGTEARAKAKSRQDAGATEERVLLAVVSELVVEEIGQVVVIGEDVGFGGGVHGVL